MSHVITVGDVLIASTVVIAIIALGGLAVWVLWQYAKGMQR